MLTQHLDVMLNEPTVNCSIVTKVNVLRDRLQGISQ